jgi:hypothetical protein
MLSKLARIYVYLLAVLMSLLFAFLLTIHITLLFGNDFPVGGRLFALIFAINVPALTLAKNRNVFANELKQFPAWVRMSIAGLWVYFAAILLAVSVKSVSNGGELMFTAFFIAYSAGCACVPLALLKSTYISSEDRLGRVKVSIGCTIAMALFFVLAHVNILNHLSNP